MNWNPLEKSLVAATTNSSGDGNTESNSVITTGRFYRSPTTVESINSVLNGLGDFTSPTTDASINSALDDLGLLSSVTSSRRQYLQEKDVFYGRLASLSMTDPQAGPSQSAPLNQSSCSTPGLGVMSSPGQISGNSISSSSVSSQQGHFTQPTGSFIAPPPNFPSPSAISSNFNFSAPLPRDSKETTDTSGTEKENNLFAGFKVVSMNSKFVTSFRNDYSLPHHVSSASNNYQHPVCGPPIDKSKWYHKTCLRSIVRRKRTRTHPYESAHVESSCQALYEMCVNEAADTKSGNLEVPSCYRLRTTSLSSGVCGGKTGRRRRHLVGRAVPGTASSPHKPSGCCAAANAASSEAGQGLVRSRSMEDLSAEGDIEAADMKSLVTALIRKKEVESVSRAIQQMCVQDSG